jgi:histone deacetylase 1/2
MVAALAALEKRKVMTMDIGSAYLNAEMKEEVYLTLEPEIAKVYCEIVPSAKAFLNRDGSATVRLRKALYGCVESAKLWYLHISSKLKKLGFVANQKDECVLNLDYEGKQLTVCLYVDDLLCTCESAEALEWLKSELVKEYKDVNSNVGPVHSYLGMTFDWSVDGKATVTMSGYISDMLTQYEVEGCRATPAKGDLFDIDLESPRLSEELSQSFASRVAKVLYLAKRVRPDILLTVNFLATRVREPTVEDWGKLTRMLQYVNGTENLGIVLEPTTSLQCGCQLWCA